MSESGLEAPLGLDVLVALLRRTGAETNAEPGLDRLAALLETALSDQVRVERARALRPAGRTVRKLEVDLGSTRFRLGATRRGSLEASADRIVRGIVLRTDVIGLDDWFDQLGRSIFVLAENDVAAHDIFQRLLG